MSRMLATIVALFECARSLYAATIVMPSATDAGTLERAVMALKVGAQIMRQTDKDTITLHEWMSTVPVENCIAPLRSHEVAVAVPARDEADTIIACLDALQTSAKRAGQRRLSVTVLVNNSRDSTAQRARAFSCKNKATIVANKAPFKDSK